MDKLVELESHSNEPCVTVLFHTWKRVGKTMGPCVAVLCADVDTVATWMLQDDRTAFILKYRVKP